MRTAPPTAPPLVGVWSLGLQSNSVLASGSVYSITARGTGCALPRRRTESRICARSPGSAQPSFSGRSRKTEPAVQGTGEWALRLRAQECMAWDTQRPLCLSTSSLPQETSEVAVTRAVQTHGGGGRSVCVGAREERHRAGKAWALGCPVTRPSCSSKMQALTCELTLKGELLLRKPQGC